MAKRRSKRKERQEIVEKRRAIFMKLVWGGVAILCLFFGYSYGYPVVAGGEVVKGFLIGLAYGGGAFVAILISFLLNQKLKGS